MTQITTAKIQKLIYLIRKQKVMLDIDLAELYEVDTGALNRAVKRNIDRFPSDFMFQLTEEESLRCQIGISKKGRGGRRYRPYVFTESGIAMLSSVVNSKKAIAVNISIIRLFIKLRSYLLLEKDLSAKVDQLERGTNKMFKIVFERLDDIDEKIEPKLSKNRSKIGLKS